jgi:signal peptidase II
VQTERGKGIPLNLLCPALAVLAADQLAKALVVARLSPGEEIRVLGPFVLRQVRNTGSAFGLFSSNPIPVLVASLASFLLLTLILYRWRLLRIRPSLLGLGLTVGGAVGNIVDRIFRGAVVDFIDIGPWPVFNLADVSIVLGVSLLVLVLFGEALKPERGRWRRT